MEPDFNKFEKEIIRSAIKAEEDAIPVTKEEMDASWLVVKKRLNLQPNKKSFFLRIADYINLNWGINYGAQTSALTFSFLVLGVFAGVGIDSHFIQENRGLAYDAVRGGVSTEKLIEKSFIRIQKSSSNPQEYIKDLTAMSLNLGLPILLRKVNSEYEIEIYNLISNDVSQTPIKVFLELPSSFDGTVKIFLTKK